VRQKESDGGERVCDALGLVVRRVEEFETLIVTVWDTTEVMDADVSGGRRRRHADGVDEECWLKKGGFDYVQHQAPSCATRIRKFAN
jgi:hypothetical protein